MVKLLSRGGPKAEAIAVHKPIIGEDAERVIAFFNRFIQFIKEILFTDEFHFVKA